MLSLRASIIAFNHLYMVSGSGRFGAKKNIKIAEFVQEALL